MCTDTGDHFPALVALASQESRKDLRMILEPIRDDWTKIAASVIVTIALVHFLLFNTSHGLINQGWSIESMICKVFLVLYMLSAAAVATVCHHRYASNQVYSAVASEFEDYKHTDSTSEKIDLMANHPQLADIAYHGFTKEDVEKEVALHGYNSKNVEEVAVRLET